MAKVSGFRHSAEVNSRRIEPERSEEAVNESPAMSVKTVGYLRQKLCVRFRSAAP
jgi:hypothetical protein